MPDATANGSAEHWLHLTDEHVRQMLRRGFKQKTIEEAKLYSGLPEQATELLGFNPHSAGVIIPFFHPFTGELVLYRFRPDRPPIIGNKPAKYLSPKGAGNRLYFPPNCAAFLSDTSVPIGLTEGEFKVLWAYQAGLFYVGSIGVWGWRGPNDRGGKGPIPDLDLVNWQDRIVTLAFDSDSATNEKVKAALDVLALEIYRRGARVVYNIELPPDVNGDKNGLDDFLHLNGVDEFLNLDAQEIPSPYPRVKVWSLAELRATHLERPAPIVPGWGIRQSGKVIFTGAGGKGKSTALLQISCDLAATKPLFAHPQLIVDRGPHRVLIYMAEDPLSEVRFRLLKQLEEEEASLTRKREYLRRRLPMLEKSREQEEAKAAQHLAEVQAAARKAENDETSRGW